MEYKELRKLLAKRLYLELQIFKYDTLSKSKKEIYDDSYKIEVLATIYEILLESLINLEKEIIYKLLMCNNGILESLYCEWLKKEDSSYEELKLHIDSEMKNIRIKEEHKGEMGGNMDGERFNQIA